MSELSQAQVAQAVVAVERLSAPERVQLIIYEIGRAHV